MSKKDLRQLLTRESEIDETIHEFKESKANMSRVLNDEIKNVLQKKFNRPYDEIRIQYADKIKNLKSSLYGEYVRELDIKLKQLYILKQEIII